MQPASSRPLSLQPATLPCQDGPRLDSSRPTACCGRSERLAFSSAALRTMPPTTLRPQPLPTLEAAWCSHCPRCFSRSKAALQRGEVRHGRGAVIGLRVEGRAAAPAPAGPSWSSERTVKVIPRPVSALRAQLTWSCRCRRRTCRLGFGGERALWRACLAKVALGSPEELIVRI